MIIRPAQKSLADSVKAIEDSDRFAFLIEPTEVVLPGRNVIIDHICMIGPYRYKTPGTGKGNNYKGPIWDGTIWIYPKRDFKGIEEAADFFQAELLGPPAKQERSPPRWVPLNYHFEPDAQPERDDRVKKIPYFLRFLIEKPKEGPKTAKEQKGYLKWEELGDFGERILLPPPPYKPWESMPAVQRMIEESVKAGRVKYFR